MAELEELREHLAQIDSQIAELYKSRVQVCEKIGDIKIDAGKKVFDKKREKDQLARITRNVEDDFLRLGLTELFHAILTCREAGHGKDRPDIYWKALDLLGTRQERTMVFEDSLHAIRTAAGAARLRAQAAGLLCAGYPAHRAGDPHQQPGADPPRRRLPERPAARPVSLRRGCGLRGRHRQRGGGWTAGGPQHSGNGPI